MGRICCMTCCFIQRVPGFETTSVMVKWTFPQWVGTLSTLSCVLQSSWLIGWGQSPLRHTARIPRYVYYWMVRPRVYCKKKKEEEKKETCYTAKASSVLSFTLTWPSRLTGHCTEFRSCGKVEVAILGSPSLTVFMVSGHKAMLKLNLGIENRMEVESEK